MAARNGFIVRNAGDVGSNLDLAEPDALDFSILGNMRYGVLRGCDLAMSGWSVTVSPGVVVNNGSVLTTGGQVTLTQAGGESRFDLVGVDTSGVVVFIRGTPSPNPVFPDFAEGIVILASVMIRPGQTPPQTNDMTDKRVFAPERFITALDSGALLGSYHPTTTSPKFVINHDGWMSWNGDTRMYRSGPGVLRIERKLDVDDLHVFGDTFIDGDLTVGGIFSSANFQTGDGPPSGGCQPGWIYQDVRDGAVYVCEPGKGWQRLSTVPIPAGMIMPSLLSTEPMGWLFLNGQQVDEQRAGGLWTAFPGWRVDTGGGQRLQLPNYANMFLREGPPGQTGGQSSLTLTQGNLPPHKHMGSGDQQMQPAGWHGHTGYIWDMGLHSHQTEPGGGFNPTGGTHQHHVYDPGHYHAGADGGSGGHFITMLWGGRRRIDGPFNDASHPVAVGEVANTVRAYTGVQVSGGGEHMHYTTDAGGHSHLLTINDANSSHQHILNEVSVGGGQAIDITPPFATVRYLIKI